MINIDEQIKIIMKGVDEIIGLDDLKEKLAKKKELNCKVRIRSKCTRYTFRSYCCT